MAFNHYAKLKRILDDEPEGWYIKRIDEPTSAKTFRGDIVTYDHYYRLYSADDKPIRYGKFQQLERFANALGVDVGTLPIIEE